LINQGSGSSAKLVIKLLKRNGKEKGEESLKVLVPLRERQREVAVGEGGCREAGGLT